jgi:hypothetical protein
MATKKLETKTISNGEKLKKLGIIGYSGYGPHSAKLVESVIKSTEELYNAIDIGEINAHIENKGKTSNAYSRKQRII